MYLPNLKISVFRMAVGPKYKTPWCGWATWRTDKQVIRGMNYEGKTREGALHGIKTMVENDRRT